MAVEEGAARDRVRVCGWGGWWYNAEGNRIDTLLNKSRGRLLNLCSGQKKVSGSRSGGIAVVLQKHANG